MTVIISRAGRKRKSTVDRRPDGKSLGERFDPEFFARQPHRRDVPEKVMSDGKKLDNKSDRAGYALGRLWMRSLIRDDQHQAGIKYASLCASYGALIGAPKPHARSGFMSEMVSSGFYSWSAEHVDDLEYKQRITKLYDECHCDLGLLGRTHHRGNRILLVVNKVCVLDDEWLMSEDDLGNLRLGLNCVGKLLISDNVR